MTRLLLFRSKSCAPRNPNKKTNMFNSKPPIFDSSEDDEEHHWGCVGNNYYGENPVAKFEHGGSQWGQNRNFNMNQFLDVIVTALRKSIVPCGVETDDVMSMDISGPTEVRHVSHVTFDRFDGFLGLPVELETEVPSRVPSASASVFGVSAKSMQCSYDDRGNSVPTILLMMQKRLYSGGGLQAEGIFRLTAENSQERHVRNQLNRGFVPRGIDVHCLAGLIKAWLRELPTGVLDSLTPEQVMNCNSEDECALLVTLLPPTESALLDWVINLMADVVEHEDHNKMNARNIAVVFAPNMTQMDDPLTALIHAVQVMNLLKTLIMRTLRERKESAAARAGLLSTCSSDDPHSSNSNNRAFKEALQTEPEGKFWSFQKKNDPAEEYEFVSGGSTPAMYRRGDLEKGEGMLDRLSLRRSNHPVFQLNKSVKKVSMQKLEHETA